MPISCIISITIRYPKRSIWSCCILAAHSCSFSNAPRTGDLVREIRTGCRCVALCWLPFLFFCHLLPAISYYLLLLYEFIWNDILCLSETSTLNSWLLWDRDKFCKLQPGRRCRSWWRRHWSWRWSLCWWPRKAVEHFRGRSASRSLATAFMALKCCESQTLQGFVTSLHPRFTHGNLVKLKGMGMTRVHYQEDNTDFLPLCATAWSKLCSMRTSF